MSMVAPLMIKCPACGHDFEINAYDSVNADRRPDIRESILDGSFEVKTCPSCAETFRLEPKFNYLDIARGQWISAQPIEDLGNWMELEDSSLVTFDTAYGSGAPPAARAIGDTLTARLTFGWAALREKIVAGEAALDDATLELAKLAVIRGFGGAPIRPGTEFRLAGLAGDDFRMSWIEARTETVVDALLVPRGVYDSVTEAAEDWAPFRAQLTQGPFVDIQKLFIGEGRSAA